MSMRGETMVMIREAKKEDSARLVDIWRDAVVATHDFLSSDDVSFYYGQLRDIYLPALEVWVAEEPAGRMAGFIGLSENKVEMLFVDPAQHGKGIGRALLGHAETLKGTLLVDVNEQNPAAHAFYLKYGFEEVGYSALDGSGRPFPLIHMAQRKK